MSLLFLALQAVVAVPAVGQPTSETEAVLLAFKDICWAVPSYERTKGLALDKGWKEVQVGGHPGADRLKASIEDTANSDHRVQVSQFEKSVGQRHLLLTIQRGELTGPTRNGFGETSCVLNELSPARSLDFSVVEKWFKRPADESDLAEDGLIYKGWFSANSVAPTIVQIAYVPPSSAQADPLPGILLAAVEYGDNDDVDPR